jgi:hypothetical protein
VVSPKITATSTNALCNGGTGTVLVALTPASSLYSYRWSNNATTASAALTANTYTVTATYATSCSLTASATITQPSAITVTALAATNPRCNGQLGSIAAPTATGGTGAFTYRWSNNTTTSGLTGLAAGTYGVVVSDANACTAISNTVTIAAAPSAITVTALVGTNPTCTVLGSIAAPTVTGGTAGYTYRWSNNSTTSNLTGLTAGTYALVVTDANTCTAATAATLTPPANAPVVSALVPTQPRCNGQLGNVTAPTVTGGTAPYTYRWSNNSTTSNLTGLTAGTYSLSVTDANACTTIVAATVTAAPSAITVTAGVGVGTNPRCNGGLGSILAPTVTGGTAGYTYRWSNNATTAAITGVRAGAYTLVVTDANACTASSAGTITEPSAITVTISNSVNTATANVTGGTSGYTYNWSGPVTGTTTNPTVTLTASTAVTVVVTDANSCTATQIANVVSGVENTSNSTLSVYPNPTTGKVTIGLTTANQQDAVNITVFNAVGQSVAVSANKVSANQYELDFSNLNAAVYTVRINVGSEVITRTVVLNK